MTPGYNLADSPLLNFLHQKPNIVAYYKTLPERVVKDKFYFEKIAVRNKSFSIIEKAEFEY